MGGRAVARGVRDIAGWSAASARDPSFGAQETNDLGAAVWNASKRQGAYTRVYLAGAVARHRECAKSGPANPTAYPRSKSFNILIYRDIHLDSVTLDW